MYLSAFILILLSAWLSLASADWCSSVSIENGNFEASRGFRRNSYVKFSCDKGYALYGDKYSFCRNGKWTSPAPKCYRVCELPPGNNYTVIVPAVLTTSFIRHSLTITIQCEEGFEAPNKGVAKCQHGSWSMGSYKGIACLPKTVMNKNVQSTSTPVVVKLPSPTTAKTSQKPQQTTLWFAASGSNLIKGGKKNVLPLTASGSNRIKGYGSGSVLAFLYCLWLVFVQIEPP